MWKLVRQYSAYSIGIAVNRLASLLLLPLYTRFLTPAEYGVLDTLMTVVTLLVPLFILGIDTSLQILFFKAEGKKAQNSIVITGIVLVASFGAVCGLILFIISPKLSLFLFGNELYTPILKILSFYIWVVSLLKLSQDNLRLNHKPLIYNFLAFGRVAFTASFNILLVGFHQLGVLGAITGLVISDIIITLFSASFLLKHHWHLPKVTPLLPLLRLGLPLIPVSFAYWILNYSDRFFLLKLSTFEELGLYGIAYRIAAGVGIFSFAVQLCWRPFALQIQEKPEAKKIYATMPLYYIACVGLIGLLLAVSVPLLLQVFVTKAYSGAVVLVTPLIVSQVAYGAYYIFSTGLEIRQRPYHLMWSILLAALLNTLLNILFIPQLGAFGASVATAISYIAATISVGIVSQKLYPLPYDINRFLCVTTLIITSYISITGIYIYGSGLKVFFMNVICVALTALLLSSFFKKEINLILNYFQQWIEEKILK